MGVHRWQIVCDETGETWESLARCAKSLGLPAWRLRTYIDEGLDYRGRHYRRGAWKTDKMPPEPKKKRGQGPLVRKYKLDKGVLLVSDDGGPWRETENERI